MRRVLVALAVLLAAPSGARAALVVDGGPPPSLVVIPQRPPLPDGADVRSALVRARLIGAITGDDARRWREDVLDARGAVRRLEGARRAELASVLGTLDGLAASGQLTAGRMPLAFLTLRRNVREWRTRPFPVAGRRMTFGRDPAVFQYFPGRGIQFHALATAGVANALARPCQAAAEGIRERAEARAARRAFDRRVGAVRAPAPRTVAWGGCRPGRLRAIMDRLVDLSSRRGDFTAWEYRFAFGGGTPPWISAMTQATAAQALARGADALGDQRYRDTALSALGAFDAPPPLGVALIRTHPPRGREYLMYSFDPGLHILNGYLQSVIGLHDLATLTGSAHARRLFEAGERVARGSVRAFDTGAWSRYSLAGRESTLSYHQLVTGFLDGLCERTTRAAYCDTAARFTRYEHEPPRLRLTLPARVTQNRATGVEGWVSKASTVTFAGSSFPVARGAFHLTWTPRHAGTAAVRVSAVGPEGLRGTARRAVRVRTDPAIVARRKAARKAARHAAARAKARRERRAAKRQRRSAARHHG